jgi:predicted permease
VDPGFQVENVVTFPLDLDWSSFDGRDQQADTRRLAALYAAIDEGVHALPGVSSAGAAWTFPLNNSFRNDGSVLLEGRSAEGTLPVAEYIGASGGYFRALGVPLVAGRFFGEEERAATSDSVIVNDVLARKLFPEGALGKRLSFNRGQTWRSVVGVVGDVRQAGLDQQPRPTVFLPFAGFPGFGSTLFVRAHAEPEALARGVRRVVHATAPDTAVGAPRTLERIRDESLASPRLTALLLGLFAGLSLTIAATGLSGVLAYAVSQRTREIGIRVVLGAAPGDVLRMVMGEAFRALAFGLGLGVLAALGVSRLVARLLFGVEPTDPLCFVGSLAVLLLAGVAACLLPARRAVAIQPATALRAQ